jgi:hypothetical protein
MCMTVIFTVVITDTVQNTTVIFLFTSPYCDKSDNYKHISFHRVKSGSYRHGIKYGCKNFCLIVLVVTNTPEAVFLVVYDPLMSEL